MAGDIQSNGTAGSVLRPSLPLAHAHKMQSCLLCKKNIDLIQERVLLQTLPSDCYSTEKTVEHALQYDKEFARAGISRNRFCIKIPATGAALNAARILSEQGIATLGTALFGLPQAIACSQAGCKYVSPYFNGKPSAL